MISAHSVRVAMAVTLSLLIVVLLAAKLYSDDKPATHHSQPIAVMLNNGPKLAQPAISGRLNNREANEVGPAAFSSLDAVRNAVSGESVDMAWAQPMTSEIRSAYLSVADFRITNIRCGHTACIIDGTLKVDTIKKLDTKVEEFQQVSDRIPGLTNKNELGDVLEAYRIVPKQPLILSASAALFRRR